ncbi:glycosyltransferase [Desulfopila sp. IMCC35008]|uniref:glycosyltransferase n=1 Tax=Desulfopila sp. IMCC35008 TaxID=2653858 RepID=UPI0013D26CE9|nr:glycosyltransferase [Desulfopila sp. IMCC35008]
MSEKNDRFINELSLIDSGLSVIATKFETRPGDIFRALFKTKTVQEISNLMRDLEPEMILVSQGAIGLSNCGLRAAKMLGVKTMSFIPMAHPVSLVRGKSSFDVFVQESLYRWLYSLPDFFLTTNKTSSDYLHHRYHVRDERILVSYYGVKSEDVSPPCYMFEKGKNKRIQLGIIGRVEFYQKRHDLFFQLITQHPLVKNFDIHILGDGPDLDACRELAIRQGIQDQVTFHGWISDIRDWYRKLDLIVMPSRFEGFPLVILEAMLYGVPIAASKVDGMKEVLPEHWLFPEGDGLGMNKVIEKILENDQTAFINDNYNIICTQLNREAYKKSFKENIINAYQQSV